MTDWPMPEGWQIKALGELLTSSSDLTYGVVQPGSECADGVPIVRVKDIRGGRIATDEPLRISPDIEKQYQRSRIEGGELLVTLVGTVGETAVAPNELRGWNTARAVATVRLPTADDSEWVGYCLQTPEGKNRIGSRVNTTVQTTLNLKDLREFPVILPPIAERRAITGVLRALDDKIKLNRRVNSQLKEVSELSLRLAVGSPVGELVGSDEDIRCIQVDDPEIEIVKPGLGASDTGEEFEYLATAVVFDNTYEHGEFGTLADLPSRANMQPGDDRVWFARMKSTEKSLWTPRELNRKWSCMILSTGFLGIQSADSRLAPLLMTAVRCREFEELKNQLCNGTTMQSLNNDAARSISFRVPASESKLAELSSDIRNNLLLEARLNDESEVLRSVRDALIPDLLSGRIRVRDAETIVERVS